jgi:amino acid transporter
MHEAAVRDVAVPAGDDARLENLGYKPQLNRVLGFFENFAVGFTYLSPMVGIYSLFILGVALAGPAYIWLTFIPLIGMLFVALVFGEFASHYPVAGALYQYSKFSVGPAYGWFVGWFYGIALLVTVAAVDTGSVGYIAALSHNWFGTNWDPTNHTTILLITLTLLAIQTTLNITGTKVMGWVAKFGVGVEILGTLGIALILAIHGFHHGLGFLFSTQGATHASSNVYGVGFGGSWLSAALIAVLAALIWGGIGSLILTAALLLAMPKNNPIKATFDGGGVPAILGQLSSGMQDFLLLLIIFAFFSCGSAVQGAGSRLAFSFGRDGALPGSGLLSKVHPRFRTPVNALITGALVSVLFVLLVYYQPSKNVDLGFITYPANTTALYSLVSFGVSGIYLSFLLAVIAAIIARSRGWVPEGAFRLGGWGWTVTIIAAAYLGLMLLNVVVPTGLSSGRALFNLDWITLLVMVIIALIGALYFFSARPDRKVGEHVHDTLEPTGAERHAET